MVLALVLSACGTAPDRILSEESPAYATLANGFDPLSPEQASSIYAEVTGGTGENLIRAIERKQGRALNMLSLSGGGQNGAFGAGFLLGWSETGRRPKFDAVAGVSTGALLATHTLLGTPADDEVLKEMYTQVTQDDIFTKRSVFSIIGGADSLMDTAPLRALIAKHITAETLRRVADELRRNRILVVGTTNVDYAQTWVWNLSLIAKDGKLDLYRKVLLASASFPIMFPPVEIDGHLFVDGAARSNVVVAGLSGSTRPPSPLYGPGNLYLIDNGKAAHPPAPLRRVLGEVAATTVGIMMDQSMQTALGRSYFGAQFLGYNFKMVAIPDDVNIGKDPLAFDPEQMQAAFDAGYALGKQADPWSTLPPDSGDIPPWAWTLIRGATE